MNHLIDMVWAEALKAARSRMPLWTALGALFMPFGVAFLIFVAKNPAISTKLGLVSAKANLVAYAATDWPAYLTLFGEIVAAGGFFLYVLVISWVFGREFTDGTLKDLLAVPVPRASIVMAKFITVAAWSAGLAVVIFTASLVTGAMLHLSGGTSEAILKGSGLILKTTGLVIGVVLPFAFLASAGRGFLLPLGMAVLMVMMANLVVVLGWGAYFPWAVPMLLPQGDISITPVSYWIVVITSLVGMAGTVFWWLYADQNR